jgi:hypothetical protein
MKKTVIILFSTLFALSFPSCSGCSGQLKEIAASIFDNTPKPPKRYTTGELKALGVNTEHLFEFTDTTMTYNGKPFMIGETIGQMMEVFGPYSRVRDGLLRTTIYYWDELGIDFTVYMPDEVPSTQTDMFTITWELDTSHYYPTKQQRELESRKEWRETHPKSMYRGKIMVNGIPVGRDMDMAKYLEETAFGVYWRDETIRSNYGLTKTRKDKYAKYFDRRLYDIDYTHIDIPKNEIIQYEIHISRDHRGLETFRVETIEGGRSYNTAPYVSSDTLSVDEAIDDIKALIKGTIDILK